VSVARYISRSLLNTIIDVAEAHGVSKQLMLSGIATESTNSNANMQISIEKVISLFGIILQQSGNQAIGLEIGSNIRPGSLNALGYALMSSKNLYEALQLQKAFGATISNSAPLRINLDHPSLVNVSFTITDIEQDAARLLHDMFLSMFWTYANWITRTEGQLARVCFTHSAPSYVDKYIETFGILPLFGQDECQLAFDKKHLEDTLYQSDDNLNDLMREQTASLLRKSKESANLYAAVTYQVRQLLPLQKATLTLVASRLNMSERTLSRKLKDEGDSFKSVLLNVRESLALEYLRNQHLSVNEIASKLGYVDYSSFSHAFRCWTGRSPSMYREELGY